MCPQCKQECIICIGSTCLEPSFMQINAVKEADIYDTTFLLMY